jgi:hypothetical protein
MEMPTRLQEEPATEGVKTGVIADGVGITLEQSTDFTGEFGPAADLFQAFEFPSNDGWAQPFVPERDGILGLSAVQARGRGSNTNVRLCIWSSSFGQPVTKLFTGPNVFVPNADSVQVQATPNLALTGGVQYFIGLESDNKAVNFAPANRNDKIGLDGTASVFVGGTWRKALMTTLDGSPVEERSGGGIWYQFTSSAEAASGQWLSSILDTKSDNVSATLNIAHDSTIPANTSVITTVEGSDDNTFEAGAEVSKAVNDLNGNTNIALSGKRYWRVRVQLVTSDDRDVPSVDTAVTLKFNSTATWISEAINCTGDVTVYNSLDLASRVKLKSYSCVNRRNISVI